MSAGELIDQEYQKIRDLSCITGLKLVIYKENDEFTHATLETDDAVEIWYNIHCKEPNDIEEMQYFKKGFERNQAHVYMDHCIMMKAEFMRLSNLNTCPYDAACALGLARVRQALFSPLRLSQYCEIQRKFFATKYLLLIFKGLLPFLPKELIRKIIFYI